MRHQRLALILLVLSACANTTDQEDDPIDDVAVSDGKADGNGYRDGTPQAAGILEAANTVPLSELETSAGVHITAKAASGIVAARPFATLTALDAVPYVGKVTFQKLLAYADEQGWVTSTPSVDPFDPSSCSGAAMTQDEALSLFVAGSSTTTLGTFIERRRTRPCNAQTGCASTWTVAGDDASGIVRLATSGTSKIEVSVDEDHSNESEECGTIGGQLSWYSMEVSAAFAGTLTQSCFRALADSRTSIDSNGDYTETEVVILAANIGARCVKRSCSTLGANCGTIDDGCGGSLDCGTCSGSETCGAGTPNVCGTYVSPGCGPNQVSCPGSTGCWDACY